MTTTRRMTLVVGASVFLPLRQAAANARAAMPCDDLSQLLSRRAEIARLMGHANAAADTLMFAIDRGEPEALARAGELPDLRRVEETAHAEFVAVDQRIAAFPARELHELLMKLRLFAHERGYLRAAEGGTDLSYDAQLLLSILRDLERLAGARAP